MNSLPEGRTEIYVRKERVFHVLAVLFRTGRFLLSLYSSVLSLFPAVKIPVEQSVCELFVTPFDPGCNKELLQLVVSVDRGG